MPSKQFNRSSKASDASDAESNTIQDPLMIALTSSESTHVKLPFRLLRILI